jgi:predicted DNA-binding mobile mystery protein A
MISKQLFLARRSLDKKLLPLRTAAVAIPPRGWARAIRDALGMTTRQLARRMGVAPSRVTAIEKAEATGAITLRTLRETAEAMECHLVYAFVPSKPLDDIVREQAERKVGDELARIAHSMRLEDQAVNGDDLEAQRRRIVADYLTQSRRRLWGEE